MVKTRNLAVPITIYLGSGIEALTLLEQIQSRCEKDNLSVSEYIKGLVEKDLNK